MYEMIISLPRPIIKKLLHYLPNQTPLLQSIYLYNKLPTIIIYYNFLAEQEMYFYIQNRAYFDIIPQPPPEPEDPLLTEEKKAKMIAREKICESIMQKNIKIFFDPHNSLQTQEAQEIADLLVKKQFAIIEKCMNKHCQPICLHNDRIIMKLIC